MQGDYKPWEYHYSNNYAYSCTRFGWTKCNVVVCFLDFPVPLVYSLIATCILVLMLPLQFAKAYRSCQILAKLMT
jgi:hypothetical protein